MPLWKTYIGKEFKQFRYFSNLKRGLFEISVASSLRVFICLEIPLAYLLAIPGKLEYLVVFIAIAICYSLHALIAIWFYKKGRWKKIEI